MGRLIHRLVAYRVPGIAAELLPVESSSELLEWNVWRNSEVSDAAWDAFQSYIITDCFSTTDMRDLTARDAVNVIMWALHYRLEYLLDKMMEYVEKTLKIEHIPTYVSLVKEFSHLFPVDRFASVKKQQDPFYYGLEEIMMRIEKVGVSLDIKETDELYLRIKKKRDQLSVMGHEPYLFYPQNLILSRSTIVSAFEADLNILLTAPTSVSPSYPYDFNFCGIPCHKTILRIRSVYIQGLFSFNSGANEANMAGNITSRNSAYAILYYLYTGSVKMVYDLNTNEISQILDVFNVLFPGTEESRHRAFSGNLRDIYKEKKEEEREKTNKKRAKVEKIDIIRKIANDAEIINCMEK